MFKSSIFGLNPWTYVVVEMIHNQGGYSLALLDVFFCKSIGQ